jgi:hypothetical protein
MALKKHQYGQIAIVVATTALIAACGGGGGGGSSTGSASATPTTLSGTAATGAAFTDAIITVTDATGTVVGTSTAVGAMGQFSIALSASATAPFVLTASRTNSSGATETLVSVVPPGSSSSTVNISQVTNLIAARLSASGNPANLASEVASGASSVTASNTATKKAEVLAILSPLITAVGVSTDPLTGTFTVNGTGMDQLLDSLQIDITPASASTSNIQISVKAQQADGVQPTAIQFPSNTASGSAPTLPTIAPANLVAAGTSALINAELAQLTACYALPTSSRVSSTVTNGLATGSASNLTASACTAAFYSSNPSAYLQGGASVGRDANGNGAFANLFTDAATGATFSHGSYKFTRNNGDIVAGYMVTDSLGNQTFGTFVLRANTTPNPTSLKLIGNQYTYPGSVNAYQQLREFVNQESSNYLSTGYSFNVPLISGINYVLITAPDGSTIPLVRGSSSMVLPHVANLSPLTLTPSGSSFVRIESAYTASSGMPASAPSTLDVGLFFVPTDFTESQVANTPAQSTWRFDYCAGCTIQLSGNVWSLSGGTVTTQYYKTLNRANTLAELKTQGLANLSTTSIADMVTRTQPGTTTAIYASLPASTNLAPSWVVPAGALPPTQVKVWGTSLDYDYTAHVTETGAGFTSTTNAVSYVSGRTSFIDTQNFGSTLRTITMNCADGAIDANQIGEQHCANPGYLATARQVGLHLYAVDPDGREYAHYYAPYSLQ